MQPRFPTALPRTCPLAGPPALHGEQKGCRGRLQAKAAVPRCRRLPPPRPPAPALQAHLHAGLGPAFVSVVLPGAVLCAPARPKAALQLRCLIWCRKQGRHAHESASMGTALHGTRALAGGMHSCTRAAAPARLDTLGRELPALLLPRSRGILLLVLCWLLRGRGVVLRCACWSAVDPCHVTSMLRTAMCMRHNQGMVLGTACTPAHWPAAAAPLPPPAPQLGGQRWAAATLSSDWIHMHR